MKLDWPSSSSDYSCNLSHIGEKCTVPDHKLEISYFIREESVEKKGFDSFLLDLPGKASVHVRVRKRCSCLYFHRDWLSVQCTACLAYAKKAGTGYKIEKNALDGCPGIEKEGRFQRRKAMGRYRL